MNKKIRNWLIIASVLVVCGALLFAGSLTMEQWDFSKLSTVEYETNIYEPDPTFSKILIHAKTSEITFLPADDGRCKVECFEMKKVKHQVNVEKGILVIREMNRRAWYDYFTLFVYESPKLTVYLPQREYAALMIETDTGDIKIPADFTFQKVEIEGSTADVECSAKVEHIFEIETTTGDMKIDGPSAKTMDLSSDTGDITLFSETQSENIKIEVDTGKVRFDDIFCKNLAIESNTGDIFLKNVVVSHRLAVETDTGDLKMDGCDGEELLITTDTGDVEGTLLSEKIFLARSNTGKINVPKTINGGRCEITTDTGDIRISVE